MRLVRFAAGERVGFGVAAGLDGDEPGPDSVVEVLDGHPFGPLRTTGERLPWGSVRLLAPVLPSKVLALAKTYPAHAAEMGAQPPAEPVLFLKPSTAVVGPGAPVLLPAQSQQVEHEAELAVVVGRLCRDVPVEKVPDVVLGYTCANDVTARDLQRRDPQWGRAKGFDTFCPLGPWVDTAVDPDDLPVRCYVDGELRQDGRTSQMVFGVAELVAWASAVMTLLPGDVILTGTPAGVGPLRDGEEVEVVVDGLGSLTNPVARRG